MSISSKARQIPSFVRKVHAIRHQPRAEHDPYKPLAAIYILRLALGLKKHMTVQALGELFENSLGDLTGLLDVQVPGVNYPDPGGFPDDMFTELSFKVTKADLLKHVRDRLKQLMKEGMLVNTPLCNNLKRMADLFGLNATEQEVLAVRLLMNRYPFFRLFITEHCNPCSGTSLPDFLRILTTRPIADIEKCLSPRGTLRKLGWLEVMPQAFDLEDKLRLPPGLLDVLLIEHDANEKLLDRFFKLCKPGILQLSDCAHLQNDLDIILPYLQAALETRQTGVNLLIHGSAEHSKTELVKLLAQRVGAKLFEVRSSDNEGMDMGELDRFAACKLTQHGVSRQCKPSLMLFAGAEAIFPNHRPVDPFLLEEDDKTHKLEKAWIDQQLANNPIPIIWIADKAKNLDPAYLRRFDYALELDKEPIQLRRHQIDQATEGLDLSREWREHLAKHPDLSMEQIGKAAAVASLSRKNSQVAAEVIMQQVLNASHRLLKQTPGISPITHSTGYDLRFTNTTLKLSEILTGLRRTPRGNFCFYGAPGTGKTAFAQHLAEQLGLPLLVKRASDILGKYVGQSERNIARMFEQARRQGAILLLDEADSLLGDRRHARQNWEVSQVNELLTQMERFHGIFICTTNLMERLDAASLRRFDFKVKFDYLHAEQRWELFEQESRRLGAEMPCDSEALHRLKQQIQRLTQLTPGDFAVLNRRATLLGTPLALNDMISVLEQECQAKGEIFSRIGFVH
ncbi:AAA family ATPase [Methylomicrobium sp. Wu6]|uniref:AAA family ATPase n=1 Tax=Methylomicrobium sp. Wu6 TaxID=3107928 RepID=UPI002DD6A310|nr:AAA family ATPase [Methylomicrobium sp. Wu6]MEC4747535.1 AAA family ATPase [Methylomicrobium sp. Wu6]